MSGSPKRALVFEKLRPGYGLAQRLNEQGIEVDLPFGPDSCLRRHDRIDEDTLIELASGHHAIVGASAARVTRRVLAALPDLRVIAKIGIGYELIDVGAATELGVVVTNTPSPVEIDCVAEHAVALMLASIKRLDFYTTERMRSGGWLDEQLRPATLRGRTVGLIGFGRIGQAVAERLRGWKVDVLVHDLIPLQLGADSSVRQVAMPELLRLADIVSLHVSSAIGAPPVLGPDELRLMKPSAIIVNTSRGGNIDQDALVDVLIAGQLGHAALDVLRDEPTLPSDPILSPGLVIATPHLAAATIDAEVDMERMAVENVSLTLDGLRPPGLLNAEVYDNGRLRGLSDRPDLMDSAS